MSRILLAGATGLVGEAALALLLDDAHMSSLVAPTRRPLQPHPKLLNPVVDSGTLPRDADWWAVDGAICAIGTTRAKAGSAAAFRAIDLDYALAIATGARKEGARRFALVSSMGGDPRSRFVYTRTKGEIEEAVERLGFPSLTIVRPGFLGGLRAERRPLEQVVGKALRLLAPVLPAAARTSPAAVVAALLVEGVLDAGPGRRVIGSAEIARIAARSA